MAVFRGESLHRRYTLSVTMAIASLMALHNSSTINMSSRLEGGIVVENAANASVAVALATLQGEYSTDPIQTRLFVPLVVWVLSHAFKRAEWLVFALEFLASFAACMATLCVSRQVLRKEAVRIGLLLMFSIVMLATQKDRRLGDLFSIAFFAFGLCQFEMSRTAGGRVRAVSTAILFLIGALIRFDLACLLLLTTAIEGWFQRSWVLALQAVIGGIVSLIAYGLILQMYEIHDLAAATLYVGPGALRLTTQLRTPGAWLSVLLLLNVALAIPFIAEQERRRLRSPLIASSLYAASLPLVANMSEYRLWLPFALVLWLCAALYVEHRLTDPLLGREESTAGS